MDVGRDSSDDYWEVAQPHVDKAWGCAVLYLCILCSGKDGRTESGACLEARKVRRRGREVLFFVSLKRVIGQTSGGRATQDQDW